MKRKDTKYAIVDIETTGGFARNHAITEIAIIIHNGTEIIDEFQSLVNPGRYIPTNIQYLTGITNEMVADAPNFNEIAETIYNLLKDCIFVAHNVNFDYSFVHYQLTSCGFNFSPAKLCTVRLARSIFPQKKSYSLGNLCQALSIPLFDRHRAYGDARATTHLFELLLAKDNSELIKKLSKKNEIINRLPLHLNPTEFENLPQKVGVYQFLDRFGKILYVGKAINIKKRVNQHFTGNNKGSRRQNFIQEIYKIEYFETGTELMALLYECKSIKQYWPKYNRALKQYEPKFDLISYLDQCNFLRLAIVKHSKFTNPIKSYDRVFEATQDLLTLMKDFDLNPLYCHYYNQDKFGDIEINTLTEKFSKIDHVSYNKKVNQALDQLQQESSSYFIVDKGRTDDEDSYIEVRDNAVVRFGFVPHGLEIKDLNDYTNVKDLTDANYYMFQLVESYKINNIQKVITN